MAHKTFISHCSEDKHIALELAEELKRANVWFDMWDMNLGDNLSEKIAIGIDEAKNFLLILSKNSVIKPWVKYELNLALIKSIYDNDYKLLVVKIDDVEVPFQLKPYLWLECTQSENIAIQIAENIKSSNQPAKSKKRQFVNRTNEISDINDYLYDNSIRFISIIGFYGIGKQSLVYESIKRMYEAPSFITINLSSAHFGARLTIELCAKAEIPIPPDGTDENILLDLNISAIETIISKGVFLIFNNFESIMDDSGKPNDDIISIITHLGQDTIQNIHPIFFISRRWLNYDFIDGRKIGTLKVRGISDKHLSQILKSEIERIDHSLIIDDAEILTLAKLLHGYPLAAKLAAPQVVKYGSGDYLIKNLHIVNQIKIGIAENIIAKIKLTDVETNILEILSIIDCSLSAKHICEVLDLDSEKFNMAVDTLVTYNLIETDIDGIILHPLINDFYLKLARSTSHFVGFTEKLANIAKKILSNTSITDTSYVYWLTNACRLLFYSGKLNEGRNLRLDLIGEVKSAAIKLYQRKDYENSLNFCNNYLDTKPLDKDILFTQARCLSRLGAFDKAESILLQLADGETNVFLRSKYNYALGRTHIENSQNNGELEKAELYFIESIKLNEHQSALQSMGELLYRQGKLDEAASFLERKLNNSPTDPYALSVYSDILWSLGKKAEAINKIMEALEIQPKTPNFLFRAGIFMQKEGRLDGAYGFFKDVIMYEPDYFDARLSLADICIDLNREKEAIDYLDWFKGKNIGEKISVLESIKANLALKQGKIQDAEKIATSLIKRNRNIVNIGLLAKVHIFKCKDYYSKGLVKIAEIEKSKAISLITEGLKIEQENGYLKSMLNSLKTMSV